MTIICSFQFQCYYVHTWSILANMYTCGAINLIDYLFSPHGADQLTYTHPWSYILYLVLSIF